MKAKKLLDPNFITALMLFGIVAFTPKPVLADMGGNGRLNGADLSGGSVGTLSSTSTDTSSSTSTASSTASSTSSSVDIGIGGAFGGGRFSGLAGFRGSSGVTPNRPSAPAGSCSPTMTKSDGTSASILDGSGKAMNANMPEGTVVYDFGSKSMVFCNGSSMGAVGGSGGCRLCRSCGGNWPVEGGMPTVWDADWSSARTMGFSCTGTTSDWDDRGSSQPPHLCCGS